jgi:desulfoferrodoxin (superoxide reductase-like protein)
VRVFTMKRRVGMLFFLVSVVIAFFQVVPAFANVPTVTGVTAWTRQSDNHTILNITIEHSGYFSGHYVNWIQVNVSGTVHTVSMTDSSPVDQRVSSTFVVPYDMGIVSDTPTVQVRANCIIHGSSSWSAILTVPEFSSLELVLFLVILPVVALLFRFRRLTEHMKASAGGARS